MPDALPPCPIVCKDGIRRKENYIFSSWKLEIETSRSSKRFVGLPSARRVENVGQNELKDRRTEYFRAVLSTMRLNTMAALAKELGVQPSTLANIQSAKRSASAELIKKIWKLAPQAGDANILSAEAVVAEPTPEARLSIGQQLDQDYGGLIRKLRGVQEDSDTNIDGIRSNFDAMDKGDVFVYLSAATLPLEMGLYDTKLKEAIANAIQREAFFVYVTPTTECLQGMDAFVDFPALFARFKSKVILNISSIKSIQNKYRQRLLHIQTDTNPLFALPDSKWELFLGETLDTPYKAAASALVVSGLGSINPGPTVRIPLSDPSTKRFIIEIANTVTNPGLTVSDQVPDGIVERLQESVRLAKKT